MAKKKNMELDGPGSNGSGSSAPRGMQREMVNLYHNIFSLIPDQESWVIQFIDCQRGKDASILVREFAKVVATSLEKKVLLLDADRNSLSHAKAFRVDNATSWEDVVQEKASIDDALSKTSMGRLHVSSVFGKMNSHIPVFDSPMIPDLFTDLKQMFNMILIDTPPLTDSADGLTLARVVDGVVVVIDAEATRIGAAHHVTGRIEDAGGNILGTILNKRRFPIPRFIYRWV